MAFKKIVLQETSCCPHCKGTTGITFKVRAWVKCFNNWGGEPGKSTKVATEPMSDKPVKTAKCCDCGMRLEIISRQDEKQ